MRTIEQYRGDTFTRIIEIKDCDGVAIDITDSVIIFSVKVDAEDAEYVVQGEAVITDPTGGIATITVDAEDMDISPGDYVYDFQWTDINGIVRTIDSGKLIINEDITR